ncbi:HTH_Tnp_Tc3_2 domain-containing protein [Trichonephila clavipes]|nr:HTH_Tnp_Tc3_2 domain-containing protein [Trichonephila clavipes]
MIARVVGLFKQICRFRWTVSRLQMPRRRNRRWYKQLSDFERWRIVGLIEAVSSNRARTSSPTTSLEPVRHHLPPSRHPVLSSETIQRRLTESGVRSHRPLRFLPLTPHHKQCRLDFYQPRVSWSVTDCGRVGFIEESRFSCSTDDQPLLHVEAARSPVRFSVYCRKTYGDCTRCDTVKRDLLVHAIASRYPSTSFDGEQLCG